MLGSPTATPRSGTSFTVGRSGSRRSILCAPPAPLRLPRDAAAAGRAHADGGDDDGCELDVLAVDDGIPSNGSRASAGGVGTELNYSSGLASPLVHRTTSRVGFLSLGPESPGADSPSTTASAAASLGLRPRNPMQLPSAPSPNASRSLRGSAAILAAAHAAVASTAAGNGTVASPSTPVAPASPFLSSPAAAGQASPGIGSLRVKSKSARAGLLLQDLGAEFVPRDGGSGDAFLEAALDELEPPPSTAQQHEQARGLLPTQRSSGLAWGAPDAGVTQGPYGGSVRPRGASDTPAAPHPRDSYSLRGSAQAALGSPRVTGGGISTGSGAPVQGHVQLASPVAGPPAGARVLPRSYSRRLEDIPAAPSPTQALSLRGGASSTAASTPEGAGGGSSGIVVRLRQQLQQLQQDPQQERRWSGEGMTETWGEELSHVQQLDCTDQDSPSKPVLCGPNSGAGASPPAASCSSPRPQGLAPARNAFGGDVGDPAVVTLPPAPGSPLNKGSVRASGGGGSGTKVIGGRRLDELPAAPNPRYARSLGVTLPSTDAAGVGAGGAPAAPASPGLYRVPSGVLAASSPGGAGAGASSGGGGSWASSQVASPVISTTGGALVPTSSFRSSTRRLEEIPAAPSPAHSRSLAAAAAAPAGSGGFATRSGGSLGMGGLSGVAPSGTLSSFSSPGVPPYATAPLAHSYSGSITLLPSGPSGSFAAAAPAVPASPRYAATPPAGGSPAGGGPSRSLMLGSGGGAGVGSDAGVGSGGSGGFGVGAGGGTSFGFRHVASSGAEANSPLRHQGSGGLTRRPSAKGLACAAAAPQAARYGHVGTVQDPDVLEEEDL
ncbi:hypothetical protein HYH02_007825 [Chlamydomonas schloesseri]|uniref:Uncharacterized protein n=1 Tax=Chlamydomonas schloesseri TaxID=2026947 RepID=A0A835WHG7_9CHLO|nr:hypothetical protein HYH02_007825 [Chlamydomonas schloesseri]|eukprot:KAG2447075.1 hypothetical protein HYH02_007825 [Chlamydomonas schloesseri]